jgi:hypothetical protein
MKTSKLIVGYVLTTLTLSFMLVACSTNPTDPSTGQEFKCPYFYFNPFDFLDPKNSRRCQEASSIQISNAKLTVGNIEYPISNRVSESNANSYVQEFNSFYLKEIVINDSCDTFLKVNLAGDLDVDVALYQMKSKPNFSSSCQLDKIDINPFSYSIKAIDTSTFKDDEGTNHGQSVLTSYYYEWNEYKLEFISEKKTYTVLPN